MTASTQPVPAATPPNPAPRGLFDERRKLIQDHCVNAVLREQALALCTFDEWTDPKELSSPRKRNKKLAQKLGEFTQMLTHRTLERAAFAVHGREFEPWPDSKDLKKLAPDVEEAFRKMLVKAFPPAPPAKGFPYGAFKRAFAAFVGGEIRMGELVSIPDDHVLALHGIPDGSNHFCFAEAVLVFLRLDLHADFWKPTLPTFVGSTQFFAARNWDRSSRRWDAYKANKTHPLVPGHVIVAAIDHLYAALSVPQLAHAFSEIVGMSLRDDPQLPRPVPMPKEFQ